MNNEGFAAGFFIGAILACFICWMIVTSNYIPITRSEWICKQARIVENDPSNTECTIYVRKNLDNQ